MVGAAGCVRIRQRARAPLIVSDHYALLDVERTATVAEIKSAFRRKIRAAHGDLSGTGTSDLAAQLIHAESILIDIEKRRLYDAQLRTAPAADDYSFSTDADPSWGESQQWRAEEDGSEASNESDEEEVDEEWGDIDSWDNDSDLCSRWLAAHDHDKRLSLRRDQVISGFAAVLLSSIVAATIIVPLLVAPSNAGSTVSAVVVTTLSVGLFVLLAFRSKFPIVATLIAAGLVVLTVLTSNPSGWIFAALFGAAAASTLVHGASRRRKARYIALLTAALHWQAMVNDAASDGRELWWILQSTSYTDGKTTSSLVEREPGGAREQITIWGWFPAGTWIDYEPSSRSAYAWCGDDAREAWVTLDNRAANPTRLG